jgi:DNA-directed RNA polymerase specialized sigma24 family protein
MPDDVSSEAPAIDSKSRWDLLVGNMPRLHAYVRRLVGDRETTNEILQEVSLRILSGDGPRERERFLAWSRGIARHVVALDWRMRRRARAVLPLEGAIVEELHDRVVDPEGHIDARASLARVMGGIDSAGLELLVRRYVFEETGKELADELAQSPAALRMRLMRLRSSARAPRR